MPAQIIGFYARLRGFPPKNGEECFAFFHKELFQSEARFAGEVDWDGNSYPRHLAERIGVAASQRDLFG